jgi:hypothetical protein
MEVHLCDKELALHSEVQEMRHGDEAFERELALGQRMPRPHQRAEGLGQQAQAGVERRRLGQHRCCR